MTFRFAESWRGGPVAADPDALELRDLERSLAALPEDQREVLLLVALEDLSYGEVAITLDIPLGTVMSRLSRARARMRAHAQGSLHATRLKRIK